MLRDQLLPLLWIEITRKSPDQRLCRIWQPRAPTNSGHQCLLLAPLRGHGCTSAGTAGATGPSELLEATPDCTTCDCWFSPFSTFPVSTGAAEGPAFAGAAVLPAAADAAGAAALAADADVLLSTGASGTECSWHTRQIECQRGSPATDIMKLRISARNITREVKDRSLPSAMHKASNRHPSPSKWQQCRAANTARQCMSLGPLRRGSANPHKSAKR